MLVLFLLKSPYMDYLDRASTPPSSIWLFLCGTSLVLQNNIHQNFTHVPHGNQLYFWISSLFFVSSKFMRCLHILHLEVLSNNHVYAYCKNLRWSRICKNMHTVWERERLKHLIRETRFTANSCKLRICTNPKESSLINDVSETRPNASASETKSVQIGANEVNHPVTSSALLYMWARTRTYSWC